MILTDAVCDWVKNYFKTTNGKKAIIGISGGKDSTVCAAICVKALGKENVFGVLMPNGFQSDIDDAREVCKILDIQYKEIDIRPIYDSILINAVQPDFAASKQTMTNLPPRIRTTILYSIAQSIEGGRVCNTSNKCESFVGWGTFGADTFGDFSPLGNLLVSEIVAIGIDMNLPHNLVMKAPADGLTGKTDEENLGVTYIAIESYIKGEFNSISEENFNKIRNLHKKNLFKGEIINVPKFSFEEYTK